MNSEARTMTRYAFIFRDSFAITIEPFVVLDARSGNEHGARIQIRRVKAGLEPGDTLAEPIWRGDLFRLTDGSNDNWDRAHYHPRFEGLQAGSRVMDPELSKDPIVWALGQLSDLKTLAAKAAAPDFEAVAADLQLQVDDLREELRIALEKSAAAARPAPAGTS
jgi:hypothetical protein